MGPPSSLTREKDPPAVEQTELPVGPRKRRRRRRTRSRRRRETTGFGRRRRQWWEEERRKEAEEGSFLRFDSSSDSPAEAAEEAEAADLGLGGDRRDDSTLSCICVLNAYSLEKVFV